MQRIALLPVGRNGVPEQPSVLSYREALEPPCVSCATSPCCTYVPMREFQLNTLADLDYALYLLNFDRIEIGLAGDGKWEVYYHYPCRFLDRRDFSCGVHGTPQQPNVCVQYNPYHCFYKRNLTQNVTETFLRIDRRRMEFIRDHVTFDESRVILDVPSWQTMLEAFAEMPIDPIGKFADSEPVGDVWLGNAGAGSAGDRDRPTGPFHYADEAVQNPCGTCHAYCCTTLMFPRPAPTNATELDYYRFLLGFPDIEVGIAGQAWTVIVRTRCRHLEGNRCAVYGKPERPLRCHFYDAMNCTYRWRIGAPRSDAFLRVKYEQFDWLAECFPFDQNGKVLELPSMQAIQEHLDDCRRTTPNQRLTEDSGVRGT